MRPLREVRRSNVTWSGEMFGGATAWMHTHGGSYACDFFGQALEQGTKLGRGLSSWSNRSYAPSKSLDKPFNDITQGRPLSQEQLSAIYVALQGGALLAFVSRANSSLVANFSRGYSCGLSGADWYEEMGQRLRIPFRYLLPVDPAWERIGDVEPPKTFIVRPELKSSHIAHFATPRKAY